MASVLNMLQITEKPVLTEIGHFTYKPATNEASTCHASPRFSHNQGLHQLRHFAYGSHLGIDRLIVSESLMTYSLF
jgi:hypothetical protein